MLLFIGFFSTQALSVIILQHADLKYLSIVSTVLIYLTMGIGSLFSSMISNKIGIKTCFFIGGLGHFFFIFTFLVPGIKYA
jgi:hypothetical protein